MATLKLTVQEQPQKIMAIPKTGPLLLRMGLKAAAQWLVGEIKENYLSGQVLNVRTGRLRSSMTFGAPTGVGGEYTAWIGSNVEYARIHEYGGGISFGTSWRSGASRVVNMPERSYVRRAMKENARKIADITTGKFMRSLL